MKAMDKKHEDFLTRSNFEQIQFGGVGMIGVDEITKFEYLGYVYTNQQYFCLFYNQEENLYRKTYTPTKCYIGKGEMLREEMAFVRFSDGTSVCFQQCAEPQKFLGNDAKLKIERVNLFIQNIEDKEQIYLKPNQ